MVLISGEKVFVQIITWHRNNGLHFSPKGKNGVQNAICAPGVKPTHTKIFIKSSSWGYFSMFLVVLWSFLTIWGHSRLLKVIFRSWSKCYGVVENGLASFYKDRKHENTNKEEFKFALSKIFYFVTIFCKNYFCKFFFRWR